MNGKRHLALAALALLFQAVPPVLIRLIAAVTYRQPFLMPEAWVWPVSMIGLAVCAAASIALGMTGTYLLLRRSRLRVAVPLIVFCCAPSLVGGSVYFLAVLAFLTVV